VPVADSQLKSARRLFDIQGNAFALTADAVFEREGRSGSWTRRIAVSGPTWTDRNVSALSLDSTGKLWIGYFDRGIDIADNGDGQKIMHVEDDQVFCVNRIVPDTQRSLQVVATANGIALFSREGRILQRLGRSDGLISEHVTDVAVRPDGLVAATAAGVTFLASGGPESIYAFHGLANNHV
jgi:ligand-binding sensor domain-containing protein